MTAPVRAITVATSEVTSYTELIGGIEAKRQALGIKQTDFDELAGFAEGLWGKVSGLLQVKQIRVEKLFDAMRAAGLRLRLEEDPEQDAKMRDRIASKYNPRQANQARPGHSSTLPSTAVLSRILRPVGRIGGKKRWHRKSKQDRSAHMTMMINSRWKRDRKRRSAAKAKRDRAANMYLTKVQEHDKEQPVGQQRTRKARLGGHGKRGARVKPPLKHSYVSEFPDFVRKEEES